MNKKEKIFEEALKLFLEKGFNETSIEDITKNASISKGSFYTYFKSKEELLENIVKELLNNVENRFYLLIQKEKKEPLEYLIDFFNFNISLANEYSSSVLTILRDIGFSPKSVRENLRESLIKELKEKIKKFVSLFKKDVDEIDVLILWGITLSIWGKVIFENEPIDTVSLSKKVLNILGG
ncbi:MAG: TetR/AcrR family transcriptional regulator [Caldisericia bacterium]|nr:TetR/AcrR family transcriptional regulator [Caldisericia bacterium]